MSDWDRIEKDERLRLALSAAGLGTWDMDLVNNRRHWSDETVAMHGIKRGWKSDEHIELTDEIMHPEDRLRLRDLHAELFAGRDDYLFEYRTNFPGVPQRWIHARGKVLTRTPEGPTRIVGVTVEITKRKQVEQQQQYNEAQFRILADSLPQLVWIADPRGEVTYYNARRLAYFANDHANENKLQWQPFIYPDHLRETTRTWAKSMRNKRDYEMEHLLKMADGSFRWHLSRATPVKAQDGTVVAWFGTATDIERLKQAEIRIQTGVERLQVATEAAAMFAWEHNLKSGTMAWAENAAEVIGCSPDELGTSVDGGDFFVAPEDRERMKIEFSHFLKAGADRFHMEFRGIHRDGNRLYWRTAGKFIRDAQGKPERAVGVTQNVTRHVEAAAQVKLLDERLAAAEEGSGALVYDYNVIEDSMWRSNSLTRVLGWDVKDIAPDLRSWRNRMHPHDAAKLAAAEAERRRDGHNSYTIEYRIRHKNGSYVWVMDTGRSYRDNDGRVIRQAGTIIDITARKKAQYAQLRMASLIELSFEPILVWHPKHGILEWNKGAEILYGYGREEAIGRRPLELLKTQFNTNAPDMVENLGTLTNWTGELQNTSQDGDVIIVESRYQLIDFDGDVVILETNRDVRASKRADASMARMAAVAAASHDALYGVSLNGIVEAWNPGAENLLGYSEKEALGLHITTLAHPSRHEEQMQALERLKLGETIKPFDTIRKTKDGHLIDVSIAMSPVIASDGTVTAISVALHDIRERKEWDKRQRLMNRELAHRVKNSFAILQAILRSTLRASPDPQHFARAFSGRLQSMAAAHDVLTENDWRGAELGALVRHQLSYFVAGQRILLTGGIINLPAEQAAPLSLILNELATNAVKYGALSSPQGRIDIGWRIVTDEKERALIEFNWIEAGGPVIHTTGPRGFGSILIERSLAGANVSLQFPPEGMRFQLTWPAAEI